MPDFEYFVFTASEDFKADPVKILQPPTCFSLLYGVNEVEGVLKGYFFVGWDSIETHEKLMADKDIHEKLSKVLSACFVTGTSRDLKHFTFEGMLEDVTCAPDTEFVLFRLQEGKTYEDAVRPYNEILSPRMKRTKGWLGASGFGPCIEEKGLYLVVLGWESKEFHETAMKDAAYLQDVRSLSAGVDLVSFVHVSLRKL